MKFSEVCGSRFQQPGRRSSSHLAGVFSATKFKNSSVTLGFPPETALVYINIKMDIMIPFFMGLHRKLKMLIF